MPGVKPDLPPDIKPTRPEAGFTPRQNPPDDQSP